MKEFAYFIFEYAAPIAIILIILYYILQFFKDSETLLRLYNIIKEQLLKVIFYFNTRKRKKYNRVLESKEFMDFQKIILKEIYNPLIMEYNKNFPNNKIEFSNLFNFEYEAVFLKTKPIDWPFESVIDKTERMEYKIPPSEKLSKIQKEYKRLIRRTIKKPKKIGYMLKNIDFVNDEIRINSYCDTYEKNLYSSFILEYELYRLYRKYFKIEYGNENQKIKKKIFIKKGEAKNFLLDLLPLRKKIHSNFKEEYKLFIEGKGRTSLMGVQSLVLCKNKNNSYDALRIKRSDDVAAKAGFLQFIPSGGFSVFEDKNDFDTIFSNYSLSKAMFREFMEECFGIEEEPNNEHISSEILYSYPIIKKLVEDLKNKRAQFKLLGSTMNLVSLCHELSFVIILEDDIYADQIRCNYECSSVISFIPINKIYDKNFWLQYGNGNDLEHLNCTSAALLNLFMESKLNI